MVQWPRLCAPNAGDLDLIPGQENQISHAATKRSHISQLRPSTAKQIK